MTLIKKANISYIIILLFFSFFFNQIFGNLGLNPIDSFFSFNTGYDILNGHFPFKDYWTITGPFIGFVQAFFYKLFGVSWSVYVLHASVINCILTLFIFFTLRKFDLNLHYSFLYSFLISILAYPSIGTPYVDHHAAYLSLIALLCFILAIKTNLKIYWFILPIVLGISFLTKQTPTGYAFIIIVALSSIYFIFNYNFKKFLFGCLGCFVILSIFFITLLITKITFQSFFEQYILFPLSLGGSRMEFLFPLEFSRVIMRFKLIHLSSIILIIIILKNIIDSYKYLISKEFLILISLITFYISLIIHQLMTINGLFIYFVIPLLAAFSHIYYLKYFKKKKYILYFLLILSAGSTMHYTNKYILSRDFSDLSKVNISSAIDAKILHNKLSGLKWITYLYSENPNKEILYLKEAIEIIDKNKKNKAIITDYQFISVILSTYDNSPSQVWFPYHVNPNKDSKYYKIHKEYFLSKMKENKVEVVYVVKPLWGGNDIFQINLNKNCYEINKITEILDVYILKNCEDLKT